MTGDLTYFRGTPPIQMFPFLVIKHKDVSVISITGKNFIWKNYTSLFDSKIINIYAYYYT